ncbi:hypothetical protein BIY24_13440 [Halobacteriovorax marinus]|uniref:sensor histidine kinase n=1 Tax=Halobacteriovorax marinus TaxID=97084 RepID=UPI000BC2C765|nr:ATP-binding protein [Halobacteriovorax marinus]ATH08913.1 hypothetical protein BIY24_13440 [Halobacteriovorax marinus]
MREDKSYLDQLFEPVIIVNQSKQLVYYNHYFSTFSGLSPRKIKKIEDISNLFTSVDKRIDLISHFEEVLSSGHPFVSKEGEIQFHQSSDIINCVVKINKVSDEEYLICFNDLSIEKSIYDKYRKQVEELKVSYKQLVHADKLKSIGELSAGISHEISNPLTIASGNTEILEILLAEQEGVESKEDILESISNIQNSLLRINKITLNMKKFIHEGVKQKKFVSVKNLIESSVSLVASSYERQSVSLLIDSSTDISAYVDELAIEQVLVNLLKNALDSVVQSNNKKKEVSIKASSREESDSFTIEVIDSGNGVDKENVESIFNPFFTTKELGEGTGMGLSLSSQIIDEHQGSIKLGENRKEHCSFIIELPSAEISNYLEIQAKISNIDTSSTTKVLVLDEDYDHLNFFIALNGERGTSFIVSRSASKSLDLLENIEIDKIIISKNLHSKLDIKKVSSLNEKIEFFLIASEEDKKIKGIQGYVSLPLDKESVLTSLSIAAGEGHEEEEV